MTILELKICEKCRNKTKRFAGFWDGENSGGYLFDCDSKICPIARRRRKDEEARLRRVLFATDENYANGISTDDLKRARRKAELLLKEVADAAGMSPAKLSAYENGYEAIPVDLYWMLMEEYSSLCVKNPKTGAEKR